MQQKLFLQLKAFFINICSLPGYIWSGNNLKLFKQVKVTEYPRYSPALRWRNCLTYIYIYFFLFRFRKANVVSRDFQTLVSESFKYKVVSLIHSVVAIYQPAIPVLFTSCSKFYVVRRLSIRLVLLLRYLRDNSAFETCI